VNRQTTLLLGAALEACFLGILCLGDLRLHVTAFLVWFGLAFSTYLAALVRLLGRNRAPGPGPAGILLAAALFRVTIFFSPPSLSDDIYRYLWEGNLVLHGENPFRHPPDAPELARYRDASSSRINHPEVSTIYPPAAQLAFAAARAVSASPRSMKALAALGDLLLAALLVRVLTAAGRDPRLVLVYAWHPLPVLELAGSGHIDGLAILFLVLSLHLLVTGRAGLSSFTLALSFLTKLFAAALLPVYALRVRPVRLAAIFAGCTLLFFLPFLDAGPQLFRGGLTYAARWRYNGSVFELVAWAVGSPPLAKAVVGGAFAAAALLLARRSGDPFHAAFCLAGLYVLLSPTVHPWYALWFLPFLCLYPRPAWIYLSGAVALSYHVLGGWAARGEWNEAPWVRAAAFVPFFVLLLLETARRPRPFLFRGRTVQSRHRP